MLNKGHIGDNGTLERFGSVRTAYIVVRGCDRGCTPQKPTCEDVTQVLHCRDALVHLNPKYFIVETPLPRAMLHVLGIVSRNKFLACLGMVEHRLGVRKETVEDPVEDASSDERVDVTNAETVRGKVSVHK